MFAYNDIYAFSVCTYMYSPAFIMTCSILISITHYYMILFYLLSLLFFDEIVLLPRSPAPLVDHQADSIYLEEHLTVKQNTFVRIKIMK